MAHTWNLRFTVLYFLVLTLGGVTVLNKAASPQNKSNQSYILLRVTKHGRTKETQNSKWVQDISDTVGKYFFIEYNLFDLQWGCCSDERRMYDDTMKPNIRPTCAPTGAEKQKVKQMAASLLVQQQHFFLC